jgi:hypothetical protein
MYIQYPFFEVEFKEWIFFQYHNEKISNVMFGGNMLQY